jgi:hypothetical protein
MTVGNNCLKNGVPGADRVAAQYGFERERQKPKFFKKVFKKREKIELLRREWRRFVVCF